MYFSASHIFDIVHFLIGRYLTTFSITNLPYYEGMKE